MLRHSPINLSQQMLLTLLLQMHLETVQNILGVLPVDLDVSLVDGETSHRYEPHVEPDCRGGRCCRRKIVTGMEDSLELLQMQVLHALLKQTAQTHPCLHAWAQYLQAPPGKLSVEAHLGEYRGAQ
jgi:hypothetical protein